MTRRIVLLVPFILGTLPAFGGYSVDISSVPDFRESIRVVAMAPGTCPDDIDCLWIEERVGNQMSLYKGITVIPAKQVRDVMFALKIEHLDEQNRAILADKLGADSFAVSIIQHAGTKSSGAVGFWTGYSVSMIESEVAKGTVQLLIVKASSGEVLMKGIGHGESSLRTGKGVVFNIFRRIIDKALGS